MNAKVLFAGVVIVVIGFLFITFQSLLPDYFIMVGLAMTLAGLVLIGVWRSRSSIEPINKKMIPIEASFFAISKMIRSRMTKNTRQYLIYPILFLIFWNSTVIYSFINMDRQLFEDFVSDFGLSGSWSLFTLNMHANIGGTVRTYPYINSHVTLFLMCVFGNIFLSAVYMIRIYRNKEKLSISPPQTQPPQ